MNTAKVLYLGDLRTQATHLRSGEWITTDAPIDNQGKGEYFSYAFKISFTKRCHTTSYGFGGLCTWILYVDCNGYSGTNPWY